MRHRVVRTAAALLCAAAVAFTPAPFAQADDDVRSRQWHLDFLNVAEAHTISQGEGVTVALIDTGVAPHPDLDGNVLPGVDFVAGQGDGRRDSAGHGTRMAGIIAAHGRGGHGVLGIAPKAKILPIRISSDGSAHPDLVTKAIEWATDHGADVISISLGKASNPELREAVERAIRADIVIVAAAGNRPDDIAIIFPAMYKDVVAVGAVDRAGRRAEISVTGKGLDITAPGVDILTTGNNQDYQTSKGTSPATAIVAGAAALIRSRYPDLSNREVVHRLTATATDKGAPGRDPEYGYGVLNLVAALTADVPPLAESTTAAPAPSASPSAVATAGPAPSDTNDPTTTLLVSVGVLGALGIVVGLPLLLTRRRKPPAYPGP